MIPIFQADLKGHLKALDTLKKGMKEEEIASIETALRAIEGGARLIQAPALAALIKGIEARLKGPLSEEMWEAIEEAKKILQSLAASEKLPETLAEKKEALEKLSASFQTKPLPPPPTPKAAAVFDKTMLELFRTEVETQVQLLTSGIVELERGEPGPELLEGLMRAAHSIKGAARVVSLDPIVQLAHAMEDCFVAAQKGQLILQPTHIDALLKGVDIVSNLSSLADEELTSWIEGKAEEILQEAKQIAGLTHGEVAAAVAPKVAAKQETKTQIKTERVLRVSAQNLSRLMGLAGETLVESRWLEPFGFSLLGLKKDLIDLSHQIDLLKEVVGKQNEQITHYLSEVTHKVNHCSQELTDRLNELDHYILRHSSLSDRLYREVIDSRMRPFSDGISGFPRMVRDMARELGKKVQLKVVGPSTPVDRDILEKLEAPLSHLLRNSVDHGIETPEERERVGKPAEGTIILEAMHRAGMLAITVSDDGRGLDPEVIRKKIVEKKLVQASVAERLTENEVLEFLFLPGFSTATNVTEISGRGVGLNVVQSMVQEVAGTVRIQFEKGKGASFHLQLPLTLSVIRALIVEISGEPYAFPLARIDRALHVAKEGIEQVENRQYFKFEGQNIGLVPAGQILELEEQTLNEPTMPLIVLSDRMNCYGIVVDKFLEERELVVHELDARLGKIPDISAGALMEDGSPLLIVDVEDMVRSIDTILTGGQLHKLRYGEKAAVARRKRILVVDDSITVREVESRLLQQRGYEVQTAVNGIDGWNALRMGEFDLVLTDVDMPRMNGIELIRLIRADPKLKSLPVLIVSYKEREEDRRLGLEAGANFYLTKSSFQDESLIQAVADLIGVA